MKSLIFDGNCIYANDVGRTVHRCKKSSSSSCDSRAFSSVTARKLARLVNIQSMCTETTDIVVMFKTLA